MYIIVMRQDGASYTNVIILSHILLATLNQSPVKLHSRPNVIIFVEWFDANFIQHSQQFGDCKWDYFE